MRQEPPLLYRLRLIKSTTYAMHQETDERRDLVYPPDSRQELLVLWSLIDVFLTCSEKSSNRVTSNTSDKLISLNISGTSGLERWSRWLGNISSVFPHNSRKYKLRILGFNSRFWREQYSRGYLSLGPDFPLLWSLHSFRPLFQLSGCPFLTPVHHNHLCKCKGIFEITDR